MKAAHSWAQKKHPRKLIKRLGGVLKNRMLWKNLFLAAVALFLLGTLGILGLFAWVSRDLPDPNSLSSRNVPQSTKIFDRTGEHLLYEISGDEKRTLVKLEELPPYVAQAAVTAEDRSFYTHHGISIRGIARAVFTNIVTFNPTGQGASTITQQAVRHAILTTEKKYDRKIKEVLLSIAVERRYTKDEIMQLYLNEIPFGSTNYGIQSASQAYFSKDAKDLTLPEAATIIAITNRPTTLLNNPDLLKERRDWILSSMAEIGYVTKEEADAAIATETPVVVKLSNIEAPHFVLWVKEQLVEMGYTDREVEQGGLQVTTSLDYDKQKMAEEAVTNHVTTQGPIYNFNNGSLVSMDPRTGEILAMVGSVDYFNDDIDGQVNVALRPRQPGSSMKPIIYTAGFEKGYTPNTLLWDVETDFPTATGTYHPRNFNLKEYGQISVRKALQGSLNIPAVKMMYLVGVDNALNFLDRLHYSTFTDRSQFGLAVVLGGGEVLLLDHTAAYAALATEGVYHAPVSILKIERPGSVVDFEWKASEGERVIDANVARMTTSILSDDASRAYIFGANGFMTLPGRPVAAKTGTTQDYHDGWTMGYTPSLVTGVWIGNTAGGNMKFGESAQPMWNAYMKKAVEGTAVENFTAPVITPSGKAVIDGQPPEQTFVIDRASGKLATEATPASQREEKKCGEFHEILYYVDRNDPRGAAPSNPAADPYYGPWESAVAAYIVRHNASLKPDELPLEACEVPIEYDDVHTPENTPTVRIFTPLEGDDVGRTLDVSIESNARRGVVRIEYRIDGSVITTDARTDVTTLTLPSWVDIGAHTLSVFVFDDVDNSATASVRINVTQPGTGTRLRITNPFNDQSIEKVTETYTIVVEIPNAENIASLSVSAKNVSTGATSYAAVVSIGAVTTAAWTLGDAGEYILSASAVMQDGTTADAAAVRVLVKEP